MTDSLDTEQPDDPIASGESLYAEYVKAGFITPNAEFKAREERLKPVAGISVAMLQAATPDELATGPYTLQQIREAAIELAKRGDQATSEKLALTARRVAFIQANGDPRRQAEIDYDPALDEALSDDRAGVQNLSPEAFKAITAAGTTGDLSGLSQLTDSERAVARRLLLGPAHELGLDPAADDLEDF